MLKSVYGSCQWMYVVRCLLTYYLRYWLWVIYRWDYFFNVYNWRVHNEWLLFTPDYTYVSVRTEEYFQVVHTESHYSIRIATAGL